MCSRMALALVVAHGLASSLAASQPSSQSQAVQVVRQTFSWSCGAAAIATLLTVKFNDELSEADVLSGLARHTSLEGARTRRGLTLLELKTFAETRGYRVRGLNGVTMSDLSGLAPLIAPVATPDGQHYVVVLHAGNNRIQLADPAAGLRTVDEASFSTEWRQRMALVIDRAR